MSFSRTPLGQGRRLDHRSFLHPEKWAVKDTSVNIAAAFNQAMELPRSTSVEYENDTHAANTRRLAPPPPRRHPSDSDPDDTRAKSPFDSAVRAINTAASFYLRQRSQEPQEPSTSIDYDDLDRDYDAARGKRSRIPLDNKAYRPSASDLDDSDGHVSDDGRKRRRKVKKKDLGPAPLTSLPVAGYDKRKRRKKAARPGDNDNEEAYDDLGSSIGSEQPPRAPSVPRTSLPPPSSRSSVPPPSKFPPELQEVHPSLEVILESDEPPAVDGITNTSDLAPVSFSIGAILGRLVNSVATFSWTLLECLSLVFLVLGRILGSAVYVVLRPFSLARSLDTTSFIKLARLAVLALLLYLASVYLYHPVLQHLPHRASPQYHAPETPISNLDELVARLQNIESALSGMSLDHQRARAQQDLEARAHGEVVNRIYALEARVREEAKRISEAESHLQSSARHGLADVKRQIDTLQSQLAAIDVNPSPSVSSPPPPASDEDAHRKLKLLEDRVGTVEGNVKEALELSKNTAKDTTPSGPAWWSKLSAAVSSGKGLVIKSADGTDVTGLISHLVDNAVVRSTTRDIVSRADFALHSAGARVIPSLTTHTLEMRPTTLRGTVLGWTTGQGRQMGRSPVTALHQDIHSGLCWPMSGDVGQLGVALSFPAYVTGITIDHVAKEVAFDMRTAPRDMEVWGLVEGAENLAKVAAFKYEQAEAADVASEEDQETYPTTLPENQPFIRLASFTYDVDAPSNIQTFPVRQEIRDLGVDFGVVALVIKNNWGKKEYTCLYRFRVHGERLGGAPQPSISEDL